MAFTGQVMADGQLPTSKTALYTVPASTTAYVKFFNIYNTSPTTQTVIVYINTSGTSRVWRQITLLENESVMMLEHGESLILEAADIIEATTTTATKVDYVITGVEETA